MKRTVSLSSTSQVEGVEDDKLPGYVKLDLNERLQRWRESTLSKFNTEPFDEAEMFLHMLLKLSSGVDVSQRDETLWLLGIVGLASEKRARE
jgi:hypothetical protein